jgi:hypothetical protein
VGEEVGDVVGAPDGFAVGEVVGALDGFAVGEVVGAPDGFAVGDDVGAPDGFAVGDDVGACVVSKIVGGSVVFCAFISPLLPFSCRSCRTFFR